MHPVLLGVMGFKEYMDQQGKFITESEANARVAEMQQTRQRLMERLEYENQQREKQQARIAEAHAEDLLQKKGGSA